MNYQEALEWVHSRPRLVKEAGLEKMRELMEALGNPQDKLKFVHVAGTNGKGSTVAMISSILVEAGYKVGMNTSPYIIDFRERFMLNGEMLAEETVADSLSAVRKAADNLSGPIKEFEAVTAAAIYCFALQGCDIVCIEAGIGGQNDSTNIINNTLVACITRVAYDHTEILGDTIEAIAEDKCGIFKNKCAVVQYPAQYPQVNEIIYEKAKEAGCRLIVPEIEDFYFYKSSDKEQQLTQNLVNYGGYDLKVPFIGRHQCFNASVALEASLALSVMGYAIEDEHIIEGIAKARLPARIEIVSKNPLIIIDGAHNEDSANALAGALRQMGLEDMSAIVAMMKDKDAEKFIDIISPYINTLYATQLDMPRSMAADDLAKLSREYVRDVFVCDSVFDALETAKEDNGDKILICGSLYLASEAEKLINNT